MPKFVIERAAPGASKMTEEEIRESSLKSLEIMRQLGPEIQWIQSYVTDDKIYCVYFAPDDTLILEHAARKRYMRLPAMRMKVSSMSLGDARSRGRQALP